MNNFNEIIHKMSLDEKLSLLTSKDFWSTKDIEKYNIPSVVFKKGNNGLTGSIKENVTCFPSLNTLGCSWNKNILYDIGSCIGREFSMNKIDAIVLNSTSIIRNPLTAKNSNSFSEDSLQVGEYNTSFISGINSTKTKSIVGSLGPTTRERYKRGINAVIDDQTLFEVYLRPYKLILDKSQPDAIMMNTNKVNSISIPENNLITDFVTKRMNYQNMIMTNWSLLMNRTTSLLNNVSLQIPNSKGYLDEQIRESLTNGSINEDIINENIEKIIRFACLEKNDTSSDLNHKTVALNAAIESAVLLKNEQHILPLSINDSYGVIGRFAIKGRFQSIGSHYVNTAVGTNFLDMLKDYHITYDYSNGYISDDDSNQELLISKALNIAKRHDKVIYFMGPSDIQENTLVDRSGYTLPNNQISLLKKISEVNKNIVVVYTGGSSIDLSFDKDAKGLVKLGHAGDYWAEALYNLMFGKSNFSGKLNESFLNELTDSPTSHNIEMGPKYLSFNEGIFVGYKYFVSSEKRVKYPFGYGLSYTVFDTEVIKHTQRCYINNSVSIKLRIRNIGNYDGHEVIQLYYSKPKTSVTRSKMQLLHFEKVFIKKGESLDLEVTIPYNNFEVYDTSIKDYCVEDGDYTIYTSLKQENPILVNIKGLVLENDYYHGYQYVAGLSFTDENYAKRVTYPVIENKNDQIGKFTFDSTLGELKTSIPGRTLYTKAVNYISKQQRYAKDIKINKSIVEVMVDDVPLKDFIVMYKNKHDFKFWNNFLKACNANRLFWSLIIKVIR